MDIQVSQLNRRLAVQLPARLPLGLVFVVGRVDNLHVATERKLEQLRTNGRSDRVSFELVEKLHRLRCELSARAAAEIALEEGDLVRAGGHLLFDPQQANYFLLARDIDLVADEAPPPPLEETPSAQIGRLALSPMLADIKKRSEAARQAPAEMPYWVQKIAPPEFQPLQSEGDEETAVFPPPPTSLKTQSAPLNDDLLSFLSDAMDKEETVEITPELLAQYHPEQPLSSEATPPPTTSRATTEEKPTQNGRSAPSTSQTEKLVGGLILLIVILTLVALIGAILLL